MPDAPSHESFSAEERRALAPYFTNLDRPVFALCNLPEVVKAALFAPLLALAEVVAALVSRRILRSGRRRAQ